MDSLDRLFYSSHFDKTMKIGAAVASVKVLIGVDEK